MVRNVVAAQPSRTRPTAPGRPQPPAADQSAATGQQACPSCGGAVRSKKPAVYCGGACRAVAHRARRDAELRDRLDRAEHAAHALIASLAVFREGKGES
jgi:hypothetical protein